MLRLIWRFASCPKMVAAVKLLQCIACVSVCTTLTARNLARAVTPLLPTPAAHARHFALTAHRSAVAYHSNSKDIGPPKRHQAPRVRGRAHPDQVEALSSHRLLNKRTLSTATNVLTSCRDRFWLWRRGQDSGRAVLQCLPVAIQILSGTNHCNDHCCTQSILSLTLPSWLLLHSALQNWRTSDIAVRSSRGPNLARSAT
jgi:hypothetical protein